MTRTVLRGANILTPTEALTGHALVLRDDRVEAIVPDAERPAGPTIELGGLTLGPGFVDVQVNGGGGVLFNDGPSAASARAIGDAHAPFGTTSFLPTLISDSQERFAEALDAAAAALAEDVPGVVGVHLEGPFLADEKRGIHNHRFFRKLTEADRTRVLGARAGRVLMTLAPECVEPEDIRTLAGAGIRIAAGHTAASYEQTRDALEAGLSGFTHLFNAMPPILSRAPGPVTAALESRAWCGVIADGHHVNDAVLRLALRAKADGRMMLVTDAMPCVGSDATHFRLGDKTIEVREGRCVDENGTLAGSSLTMIDAVRNAVRRLGQPLQRAVAMAATEPARFLGLEGEIGSLCPGARADLFALTADLEIAGIRTRHRRTGVFSETGL